MLSYSGSGGGSSRSGLLVRGRGRRRRGRSKRYEVYDLPAVRTYRSKTTLPLMGFFLMGEEMD